MDINNIKQHPATKKPEDWDEPILWFTSMAKLRIFKGTNGKYPSKDYVNENVITWADFNTYSE